MPKRPITQAPTIEERLARLEALEPSIHAFNRAVMAAEGIKEEGEVLLVQLQLRYRGAVNEVRRARESVQAAYASFDADPPS